jgi:hypothetical protein
VSMAEEGKEAKQKMSQFFWHIGSVMVEVAK